MTINMKSITTAKVILIVLSAIVFFALRPLYSFDSYWYISYLDYFEGLVPFSEWDAIRGFVFPTLLFIAHKIHPGNAGIEIVFLIIYLIYHYSILKVYSIYKNYAGLKENLVELVVIEILLVYSPIIWTYSHRVLTEGMAYPLFCVFLIQSIQYYLNVINGCCTRKKLLIYMITSMICLLLAWYLKQSFAIYIFIMFIGIHFFILIRRKGIKFLLLLFVLFSCLIIGWRVSKDIKGKSTQNDLVISGVNTSMKLRYFIVTTDNVVEIKNDEYETIDAFIFNSRNSGLARDVDYLVECSRHNFTRVVRGIVDNYMILTSAYYTPNHYGTWLDYAQGYVERNAILEPIKGHNAGKQSENERLCYLELKEPTNYYEDIGYKTSELNERGIRTNRLSEYGYVAEKNIITRLISWKYYWAVTETLFIVTLMFAIWCWFPCGIVALIKKNPIIDILAINTMACFAFLSAHVYIGAAIERYSVPVYVTELLCLICTIIAVKDKIMNRGIDNA